MTVYKIIVVEDDICNFNDDTAERVFYTSEQIMDITKAIDENVACYQTREEHDDANGELEAEDEDDDILEDDEEEEDFRDDEHSRGEN